MHPYQTPCQGVYTIRTAIHTTYVRTLQVHNHMTITNIHIQHWHLIHMTPVAYPWSFVTFLPRGFRRLQTVLLYMKPKRYNYILHKTVPDMYLTKKMLTALYPKSQLLIYVSAPWWKSKCLLLMGIRMLSRWAWWRNVLRMFRQFLGALVLKSSLKTLRKWVTTVATTHQLEKY